MRPEGMELAANKRRFDDLEQRLSDDPDGLRREIEAELITEHGQAWFDANRRTIDDDWACAVRLLGFEP